MRRAYDGDCDRACNNVSGESRTVDMASLACESNGKEISMIYSELWVDEYIAGKKLAWARTSIKNERYRLRFHGPHIFDPPAQYYLELSKRQTNHSIKTTLTRLGMFYQFLVENEKIPPTSKNPWKAFLVSHALLFKHSYVPERLKVTYKEAMERIQTMEHPYRLAALQMLESGMRYCELRTFDGEKCIGKGSKTRYIYLRDELRNFRYRGSYSALFVRLKALGLKPHSLRKLCATEFCNQPGANDMDLCEVFGWESIETSYRYRQPKKVDHLKKLLQNVVDQAATTKTLEVSLPLAEIKKIEA